MYKNGTGNKTASVFVACCLKFKAHERAQQGTIEFTFYSSLKLEGRMYQGSEEIQIN